MHYVAAVAEGAGMDHQDYMYFENLLAEQNAAIARQQEALEALRDFVKHTKQLVPRTVDLPYADVEPYLTWPDRESELIPVRHDKTTQLRRKSWWARWRRTDTDPMD
jgi:hypothetical protein